MDLGKQRMRRFEGKTVLITGAARGQGRSHAVGFAAEGANVAALDIAAADDTVPNRPHTLASAADLEETARQVEELDRRCLAIQADVRDRAAVEEAVRRTVSELGGIDVLVANAGITTVGPLVEQEDADWHANIDTILTGTWNTLKPVVPHMLERGPGGRIVLTASAAVRWPQANVVPYLAAKFGIIGIVKGLSQELTPHGITVNAVNPGLVNTPMLMNQRFYELFVPDKPNPTRADAEAVFTEMGANGDAYMEPEDITKGVLYLASPEAEKVSGMALDVSGGANAYQAG